MCKSVQNRIFFSCKNFCPFFLWREQSGQVFFFEVTCLASLHVISHCLSILCLFWFRLQFDKLSVLQKEGLCKTDKSDILTIVSRDTNKTAAFPSIVLLDFIQRLPPYSVILKVPSKKNRMNNEFSLIRRNKNFLLIFLPLTQNRRQDK